MTDTTKSWQVLAREAGERMDAADKARQRAEADLQEQAKVALFERYGVTPFDVYRVPFSSRMSSTGQMARIGSFTPHLYYSAYLDKEKYPEGVSLSLVFSLRKHVEDFPTRSHELDDVAWDALRTGKIELLEKAPE